MNVAEKIDEFLRERYEKDILKAASKGQSFVSIDFNDMDRFDIVVAENLLERPDEIIEQLNEAAEKIADGKMIVRVKNLPERRNIRIRNLRAVHLNKLWTIDSTIKSATEVKPQIYEVDYECPSCGTIIKVKQKSNLLQKPEVCECGRRGDFKQVEKRMFDMRWLNAIEPFEITTGEQPGEISVFLKEDLTTPKMQKMTDPGSRLRIVGVLKELPKRIKGKLSTRMDVYLEANYIEPAETEYEEIEITEEDKKEIIKLAKDPNVYEKLKASLAPAIYGFDEIKESILLQLFGGINHRLPDGTRIRGNIHILITGDPGVGKSQILKLVSTVVPRGRYVSGKGVTGAGLCMSYDTLVPSAHGDIVKIGDVVEDALKKEKKEIQKDVFVSEKGDFEIVCLDPETLKIKKKKVTEFFKLRQKNNLIKIKTKSGREIDLTKNNPVLTIREGRIVWKKINEFKKGDYIGLPRYIPLNDLKTDMKPEFARFAGMVAGDGDVGNREIRFHNTNKNYLNEFAGLTSKMGYKSRVYHQNNRIPCVRVASKNLCDALDKMGIPRGIKCDKIRIPTEILRSNKLLSNFLSGLFSCDGGVVNKGNGTYIEYTTTSERMAREIQTSLLRFGILSKLRKRSPSKEGFGGKRLKYVIVIRGHENLKKFDKNIGFSANKNDKLKEFLKNEKESNTNIDIIPNIGPEISKIRKSLGIKIKSEKDLYLLRHYEKGRRNFSRKSLLKFSNKLKNKKQHSYFDFLKRLSKSEIFWDQIENIEESKESWVYDLAVEGDHNFVANDFIVHNTATVRKDEMLGSWVLEAGALILCNRGLISIDEFDKMNRDDQIAMHEAMSMESVSIAKANIVATLPAQTAVLAGANPKMGRFDPMLSVAEQIQIPETLLSRFDLKFALKDKPDKTHDEMLAEHIITSRTKPHMIEPIIDVRLIRKFIAYSKQIDNIELSPEAAKSLKNFYVDMRNRYSGEEVPTISITLRQYEALIRMAEASAKIRLDDVVRMEDADRAIKLMKYSLSQLGVDAETGRIDIDKIESGITASKRRRFGLVSEIIAELQKSSKEIAVEDIKAEAESRGIEGVDEIIEKLKRDGVIFEPRAGFIRKI